jgi:hypothetical protein
MFRKLKIIAVFVVSIIVLISVYRENERDTAILQSVMGGEKADALRNLKSTDSNNLGSTSLQNQASILNLPKREHFSKKATQNRIVYFSDRRRMKTQEHNMACKRMKKLYSGAQNPAINKEKKKIIWYDVFHNGHGLRNSTVNAMFDTCDGAAKNCVILDHAIADDIEYNGTVRPLEADAVLMQGCHLKYLPSIQRRDEDQVFVLAERENWWANKSYQRFRNGNQSYFVDVFNWTMTYRLDSDIYLPYGHIVSKNLSETENTTIYTDIYNRKRRSVVWMVSHCHTQSDRENYVKNMAQYIDIDIYGNCGNYTCPLRDVKCLLQIIETYKFVLSFENTYHINYVTEKLFEWFPRHIIHVVRGGGLNYSYYGVPEGTIIDADQFSSPKALAYYLNRLGKNKEKYIKMLKTKDRYMSLSIEQMQTQAYCRLCAMLNDLDNYRQSYTHIGAWFASDLYSSSYCIH